MFPGKKSPWNFTLNLSKFLQAKMNVLIFRFLPFHTSRVYLRFLGRIYYGFRKKEQSLIKGTLKYIFGKEYTPRTLKILYTKTFRGIIDHYHEKLFIAYSNFPQLMKFFINRISLSGEDEFKACLDNGQGIILVTAHYGAVEALPGALAARGYPVTMILRFQTERLKKSLVERAETMDLHLVDLDEGNVFFTAVNALKQGRILITECDEFDAWRTSKQYPVSFFGHAMDGDKTLEILRKRSGASVATALMQRMGNKRYNMKLTTLITDQSDKRSVGKAALEVLEESIKESPEHWYQWKDFGEKLEQISRNENNEKLSEYIDRETVDSVSL